MVISSRFKGDAFRLAAVLYADNNYEVKPRTILRKIIESLFIQNENVFKKVDEILDDIKEKYDFVFSEEEVVDNIKKYNKEHFFINKGKDSILVCLNFKRYELLKKKINNKNIDFFIEAFLKTHSEEFKNVSESKKTIYRFLYEVFNTNVTSFSKLIDSDVDLKDFISNLNHNFKPSESSLINKFLRWDNDGKNKAIFDISSFALEYCLITNRKSDSFFQINNLKNKNFFLDTNVIFRAIGVNGDIRKKRTLTFLDKFIEAEENLILSKYSEEEFLNTLEYYLREIEKNISPRISSKVFLEFSTQTDFFNFYYRWRSKRTNCNIDLFKADILSKYEALKRKYKISELIKIPFSENSEENKKKLNEIADDIYASKRFNAPYPENISYESIDYDARNIFLIESLRGERTNDIFETKFFIISTDQLLKRWDLKRNHITPVVILPSQWLTILLRYYTRTTDDFKSFVSFLNLSHSKSTIKNTKLNSVLMGISEITSDMEEQSLIVKKLIAIKFDKVISKGFSNQEIIEHAKEFTKTTLEEKVESLKKETSGLKSIVEKSKEDIQELKNSNTTDKKLRSKFEELLLKKKITSYKRFGYLYFIFITVSILFLLLIFILQDSNWNVVKKLISWTNTLDSTQLFIAQALIYGIPIGTIVVSYKQIKNHFFDKNHIGEKEEEIINELRKEN